MTLIFMNATLARYRRSNSSRSSGAMARIDLAHVLAVDERLDGSQPDRSSQ